MTARKFFVPLRVEKFSLSETLGGLVAVETSTSEQIWFPVVPILPPTSNGPVPMLTAARIIRSPNVSSPDNDASARGRVLISVP